MLKFLLLISVIAWAGAIDDDLHAQVEKTFHRDDGHGHFSYGFDITNGIGADETGNQAEVHGEYHFTTREGKPIKVSYTADANGFHPKGDVIPTPPPTPAAILKALEYIKSHSKDEKKKH